ncbi:MAG: hypothetical protein GY778_23190 [bacterium]|nr:hypothetical protein [bacterium]
MEWATADDGDVTNSGSLTANGGNGEYIGGDSWQSIWLEGYDTVNSGSLSLRGGNADAGLAGSVGGNGGTPGIAPADIYVTCSNTGGINVSGGTGTITGADGDAVTWVCP